MGKVPVMPPGSFANPSPAFPSPETPLAPLLLVSLLCDLGKILPFLGHKASKMIPMLLGAWLGHPVSQSDS